MQDPEDGGSKYQNENSTEGSIVEISRREVPKQVQEDETISRRAQGLEVL